MAVHFHVRTSDSMPERLDVTREVERLKLEQAQADREVQANQSKPIPQTISVRSGTR
jgi:hypothetical protein